MLRYTSKRQLRDSDPKEEGQYEVVHFSLKHGLSIQDARRILREAGSSREKADAEAEDAKKQGTDTDARPPRAAPGVEL